MVKMTELTVLDGIGTKRASKLQERHINSVEELAKWKYPPTNWKKFVIAAQQHLQMKQQRLSSSIHTVEEKKQRRTFRDVLYIRNHSWWKLAIELLLPSEEKLPHRKHLQIFQAIMYELCIEPNDRPTVLCQVYIQDTNKTKTLKFGTQFIISLNGQLPPLKIYNLEQDEEHTISNFIHREAFQNNLIETNILQHLSKSLNNSIESYDDSHFSHSHA